MSLADWLKQIEKAWPELRPLLIRYLRTLLKSTAEAQDAAQETYIRLRRYTDPAIVQDLTKLACTIAKNVALQWLRERARHRRLGDGYSRQMDAQLDTDQLSPERAYAAQNKIEVMSQAFAALPERAQIVYTASLNGDTPKDIARRFGLSLSTVYRDLTLAHQHLLDAVNERSCGENGHE